MIDQQIREIVKEEIKRAFTSHLAIAHCSAPLTEKTNFWNKLEEMNLVKGLQSFYINLLWNMVNPMRMLKTVSLGCTIVNFVQVNRRLKGGKNYERLLTLRR